MKRDGFTLIELLVAMSLLLVMAGLALRLVDNSFDLFEEGDRRGDLYDLGYPILERLENDLLALAPEGGRRLLVRGSEDGTVLQLSLVRTIPGGEERHFALRRAGTVPMEAPPTASAGTSPDGNPLAGALAPLGGNDPAAEEAEVFSGDDLEPEARAQVPPPAGLMEVCYLLVQEEADPPGTYTLFRGERSPADGRLFPEEADRTWARAHLRPIANGILGLWVAGADGDDFVDSWTRALPPARLKLTVHVARPWSPEARLAATMGEEGNEMVVNRTTLLPDRSQSDHLVKVGDEWMEIAELGASCAVSRGRRGTASLPHPVGTPVFYGRTFHKIVEPPVAQLAGARR